MADFVQTMKDWHRMCNKYFDGKDWECNKTCPMYGFGVCSQPTAKYPVPLDIGQDLAHEIDCVITAWVKENPEPIYPTWAEWLYSQGLMTDVIDGKGGNFLYNLASKPIPADIAEKLGIQPKEN